MTTINLSIPTDKQLLCYHCGEVCSSTLVREDEHAFCCEGCKLVYGLLKDNGMCTYYSISQRPGHSAEAHTSRGAFASLDDPETRANLIRYEDAERARVVFSIPGIHCSSCIWLLENLYKLNPGISTSRVHFARKEATIDFDPKVLQLSDVAALMASIGYAPALSFGDTVSKKKNKGRQKRALQIGIAGFCFGNIMLLSFPEYLTTSYSSELVFLKPWFNWLSLLLSIPVVVYAASDFFFAFWRTIRYRDLSIDTPIALAIAITFLRSVYDISTGQGPGFLDSMSGIVFFMLIGRWFQEQTSSSLSFEQDYKSYFPIAVTLKSETGDVSIPVSKLKTGDLISIRSGELIPADAILKSEHAALDYSFVTGEADPVMKKKGDRIYAGARQTVEAIDLEVLQPVSQSYLTSLWNSDAFTRNREDEQRSFVDKTGRRFSIFLLALAFGSALVWMFIDPKQVIPVFTSVLIVACPCTLLLAATFTNGSVMRWLARKGLYLKHTSVIERLGKTDVLVFDKTGTITQPSTTSVYFDGDALTEEEQMAVAALAAQSGHPLSRSISAFLHQEHFSHVDDVRELEGKGVEGRIAGKIWMIGSRAWAGYSSEGRTERGTEVWLAVDGQVRGCFVLAHVRREGLEPMINQLKKTIGVELVSGDYDTDQGLLDDLFDRSQMYFRQSPEDKLNHVRALQERGKKVLMVGDGLNDAGALAQADTGIVVTDQETSYFPSCDALIDGKQMHQLVNMLQFTKSAKRIITGAFILSLIYNTIGLSFAVTANLSPMVAAILMPVSSISVIIITTVAVAWSARIHFRSKN